MDYKKIYEDLISKTKDLQDERNVGYFELHHIIPDFMFKNRNRKGPAGHLPGDSNIAENLVKMTPREHILAHLLLCKIYRGSHYEYPCLTSLLIMLNGGGKGSKLSANRQALRESFGKTRLYQSLKTKAQKSLSEMYLGKMMARDVKTGKMIGMVETNHPKVLSGEWKHHTYGSKLSDNHRDKISKRHLGLANGNSKGYTDDQLIQSYIECCKTASTIVSCQAWIKYAIKYSKPYIKAFKGFRFEGKGFLGLRSRVEDLLNMKYIEDRKKAKQLLKLWQ